MKARRYVKVYIKVNKIAKEKGGPYETNPSLAQLLGTL
jgi:hypothetical protein